MTAMSAPSTGFRFGYALGTLTREFLRSMKRTVPRVQAQAQVQPAAHFASITPTRNDWDELCRIPTIARRGVDLNQWFDANTKPVPPTKRRNRPRKPDQRKTPELRMGSLDDLIAPVATI
ncbi:hypothetical protein [Pseudomonas palmensis]|uniref:hypothetical protein n=1 Tax=Pseudomonas palmensis TaxID=2815362 RepID=UPI003CF7B84C